MWRDGLMSPSQFHERWQIQPKGEAFDHSLDVEVRTIRTLLLEIPADCRRTFEPQILSTRLLASRLAIETTLGNRNSRQKHLTHLLAYGGDLRGSVEIRSTQVTFHLVAIPYLEEARVPGRLNSLR